MAKRTALSTSARRALVAGLVNQGLVGSQADLVELLASEGIEVTQATASRDLEEVGAVRGREPDGVFKYRIISGESGRQSRLGMVSDELLLSLTASGNIVVVKTPAGGAQLLASTLDRAASRGELETLIGTIAGDDTVLAISKSPTGGAGLAKQLRNFISKPTEKKRK